jgi:hypothetical protein
MNLISVDPWERLPNLVNDEHHGLTNLMVNLPRYWCPHCEQYTVFDVALGGVPSSFDEEVKRRFNRLAPPRDTWIEGQTDFFCRGCGRPVRITYMYSGEYAMSAYTTLEQ